MHQLEFYINIEGHFPLLRLCENHYKAQAIVFEDYTHWHILQYTSSNVAKPQNPHKRSRSMSHAISCKAPWHASLCLRALTTILEDDCESAEIKSDKEQCDDDFEEDHKKEQCNGNEANDDSGNDNGEKHEGDDEVNGKGAINEDDIVVDETVNGVDQLKNAGYNDMTMTMNFSLFAIR